MLKVEGLSVFYGEYRAVSQLSFHIDTGELVSLIGANGAGKTSTIKAILGLVEQVEGEIWLEGRNISGLKSHERVKAGVSIVPEGRKIFPELSVMQNLLIGAYSIKDKAQVDNSFSWVLELFPILAKRTRQMGGSLSGGEQQMLAIARSLMARPKLLLIDEVSMGLMPIAVDKVFGLIKNLNENGMTILLVEQNARKALSVSHRGYVLESGHIVMQDKASELAHNKDIMKAYLGE